MPLTRNTRVTAKDSLGVWTLICTTQTISLRPPLWLSSKVTQSLRLLSTCLYLALTRTSYESTFSQQPIAVVSPILRKHVCQQRLFSRPRSPLWTRAKSKFSFSLKTREWIHLSEAYTSLMLMEDHSLLVSLMSLKDKLLISNASLLLTELSLLTSIAHLNNRQEDRNSMKRRS